MDVSIEQRGSIIYIDSYRYSLHLDMGGCTHIMSRRDFNKMLSVVGHLLYPEDFYQYLRIWEEYLTDACGKIPRAEVFLAKVRQKMEKLPGYVFDE